MGSVSKDEKMAKGALCAGGTRACGRQCREAPGGGANAPWCGPLVEGHR